MTTSLPPQLEALLLLGAYNTRQSVAQSEQKDCLWNLQKARRQAMRGSVVNANVYSAATVREDVYPRAMVVSSLNYAETDDAPELVTDNVHVAKKQTQTEDVALLWTLVDPVALEKETTKKADEEALSNKENNGKEGLRQRKGKQNPEARATAASESKWTTGVDEFVDEDAMLRVANPIELFGALPPRDLREAQVNANAALQAYIDAANFAAAILKLVGNDKK
ncbi:hypothetical protein MHU86_16289 [Fragilaria crotonensis]|nr:hypothetical protein MHU86_16289 [Fragilaria crotonensis]